MITDRTERDALLGTEKGTYSYTDLNRVEKAVADISGHFKALGIGRELITKTDWDLPGAFSVETWPVETQMQRYLENVRYIKNFFRIGISLPGSMDELTWRGANNIEKVLETATVRVDGIFGSYHYSGEIFAGEEYL